MSDTPYRREARALLLWAARWLLGGDVFFRGALKVVVHGDGESVVLRDRPADGLYDGTTPPILLPGENFSSTAPVDDDASKWSGRRPNTAARCAQALYSARAVGPLRLRVHMSNTVTEPVGPVLELLSLAHEIWGFATTFGGSVTHRDSCNSRLDAASVQAIATVPFADPAYREWSRTVMALRASCAALLRRHAPESLAPVELLDAATTAIGELRCAAAALGNVTRAAVSLLETAPQPIDREVVTGQRKADWSIALSSKDCSEILVISKNKLGKKLDALSAAGAAHKVNRQHWYLDLNTLTPPQRKRYDQLLSRRAAG